MSVQSQPKASPSPPVRDSEASAPRQRRRWRSLTGGGTAGNEQLTATVGAVLLVLLAGLGVTIVRIGQLLSLHLILGLVLIGPVAAKLASTGYRFTRYYTGDRAYRRKGPPLAGLRLLAPIVVATTAVVFASGVLLLFEGPTHRGLLLLAHKASFFVWLAAVGLHVLGHLAEMPRALRAVKLSGENGDRPARGQRARSDGGAGRWITIGGSLVGGLVLAIALSSYFSAWTHSALSH